MAIVNQITLHDQRRYLLISYRNGFTSFANFFILSCALFLFSTVYDPVKQFQYMSLICCVVGSFSSLFYIYFIREIRLENLAIEKDKEYRT